MTNKLLLAAIALGLWAIAIENFVRPVHAQDDMSAANDSLSQIAESTHALAYGGAGCLNTKICD